MRTEVSGKKRVLVIGAGWYGCHLAKELAENGHQVHLSEKSDRMFNNSGPSGQFGIRLHIGPHYPRSSATRKSCQKGYVAFTTKYPELVVAHDHSIYALGETDAKGQKSKVSRDDFLRVCEESSRCKVTINKEEIENKGYRELQAVVELDEPSIYVGKGLHDYFIKKFESIEIGSREKNPVHLHLGQTVTHVDKEKSGIKKVTFSDGSTGTPTSFDEVINATGFQALLPTCSLPFEIKYQPCLALVYKDKRPLSSKKPFSFIVMDGWYPCLMPSVKYGEKSHFENPEYILTHGSYTIMGSYDSANDANNVLEEVDDDFIQKRVRPNCEKEINRFYPEFSCRFEYQGWRGAVLAKIKNNQEFRSSIAFKENSSDIIHVVPGKISNIFDASDAVLDLITRTNILRASSGISYVKDRTLDRALPSLTEPLDPSISNTCNLQTYSHLFRQSLRASRPSQEESASANKMRVSSPNQGICVTSLRQDPTSLEGNDCKRQPHCQFLSRHRQLLYSLICIIPLVYLCITIPDAESGAFEPIRIVAVLVMLAAVVACAGVYFLTNPTEPGTCSVYSNETYRS